MIHELKTWQFYYADVISGNKNFEVRKGDRNFEVGDTLHLKEYDPHSNTYTGRECRVKVGYILFGGQFGIEEGFVVMGFPPHSLFIIS